MARKELSPYAPDVWIRQLNRKYPNLWTDLRKMYAQPERILNSKSGGIGLIKNVPDWCFMPTLFPFLLITNRYGESYYLTHMDEMMTIGSLYVWRASKGIYRFAPEIYEALSKLTRQVQVQKKRNPDRPQTGPKIDGNHERFKKNQCIGITRGGRNTKIHAVVDALGNPIHVQLSSGDIHDSIIAEDVLNQVDLKPNETTVLADKAYGSFALREYIAKRDTDFCIPPKSNSVDPWYCDWALYKERHLVECFFNKLKENRRIAPRFDKLASRFLAFVHLGCIRIQLA